MKGIGPGRLRSLIAAFGSAVETLERSRGELCSVAGITEMGARAVARQEIDIGRRVIEQVEQPGGTVLIPGDPLFPEILELIPSPPPVLFAAGRVELLRSAMSVAVVGARSHTGYGATVCRRFAGALAARGVTIVSGMARGIDAIAHQAALDSGGRTVGVLGNGLDVIYPQANRKLYAQMRSEGCLLSEFPPGEPPSRGSFPRRNRLISGLSRATLIIEANRKSGAIITGDCALAQGRDVLAVPGHITSPTSDGCNRLIQQGATPVLDLADLLQHLGLETEERSDAALPDLTGPEVSLLNLLKERNEHADDLAHKLGWSIGQTLTVLTSLELQGVVERDAGKTFRLAG